MAGEPVENLITSALLMRIEEAFLKNENFKVIIILPLLPGFEGDVTKQSSSLLRNQLHWQYNSISRGGSSLIESLKSKGINPKNYISFFGLRNHGLINNKPVTEMIYVHSKVLFFFLF